MAGGYEKLVLYGTSYGTKVAEEYAQAYPEPCRSARARFRRAAERPRTAQPRDIRGGPADPAPAGRRRARLRPHHPPPRRRPHAGWCDGWPRGPLSGRCDRRTRRPPTRCGSPLDGLLGTLVEGDLEPTLRSEFPAAVRSAVQGDTAPLARLSRHARKVAKAGEAETPSESFDNPLYYATSCEDRAVPVEPLVGPGRRASAEAQAQIRALPREPARPVHPRRTCSTSATSPACAFWPFADARARAPLDRAPFPSVPTLILSGADDLRTPTSNAREVGGADPRHRTCCSCPNTGHSVLSSDPTHCVSDALQALFARQAGRTLQGHAAPVRLLLPDAACAEPASRRSPRRARKSRAAGAHAGGGRSGPRSADFDRQPRAPADLGQSSAERRPPLSLRSGGLRERAGRGSPARLVDVQRVLLRAGRDDLRPGSARRRGFSLPRRRPRGRARLAHVARRPGDDALRGCWAASTSVSRTPVRRRSARKWRCSPVTPANVCSMPRRAAPDTPCSSRRSRCAAGAPAPGVALRPRRAELRSSRAGASAAGFECTTVPVPVSRTPGLAAETPLAEPRAQTGRPRPRAGPPSSHWRADRVRRRCRSANSSPKRSPRRSARAICWSSTSAAPAPRTR